MTHFTVGNWMFPQLLLENGIQYAPLAEFHLLMGDLALKLGEKKDSFKLLESSFGDLGDPSVIPSLESLCVSASPTEALSQYQNTLDSAWKLVCLKLTEGNKLSEAEPIFWENGKTRGLKFSYTGRNLPNSEILNSFYLASQLKKKKWYFVRKNEAEWISRFEEGPVAEWRLIEAWFRGWLFGTNPGYRFQSEPTKDGGIRQWRWSYESDQP